MTFFCQYHDDSVNNPVYHAKSKTVELHKKKYEEQRLLDKIFADDDEHENQNNNDNDNDNDNANDNDNENEAGQQPINAKEYDYTGWRVIIHALLMN